MMFFIILIILHQAKIKGGKNKMEGYVFNSLDDIRDPILWMLVAKEKKTLKEAENIANQRAFSAMLLE